MRTSRPASRLLRLGLLLLCATPSRRAAAQGEPSTIPVTLVHLLLARTGGAAWDSQLIVGAPPASFPAELLPPAPATVVGGVSGRYESVAIFSDSGGERLSAYLDRLQKAGWRTPRRQPTSGFQSSIGGYEVACRDSVIVMPRALTGPDRRRYLAISYRPHRPGEATCDDLDASPRMRLASELAIPALTSPPGRATQRSSSSAGGGRTDASAELRDTTLAPAALAAHYAAQLMAAGWSVGTPLSSDRAALIPLDAHDASGHPWSGELTVTTRGAWRDVRIAMRLTGDR